MSKAFITGLFGSAGGGKPEEERVVNLDMADGDQIVTPTAGTTMSKVTVTKPNSLVPENVKLNTVIGGVTGSYAGQRTGGEFIVQVIDIDGTVLDYAELNAGDTFTLPTPPDRTAEGLIFQKWVSVFDIIDNTVTVTDDDILIGATYETADGDTRIFINLSSDATVITLSLNKSNTGNLVVDWGDGYTSNSIASGVVGLAHSYTTAGEYEIKIKTQDEYALGGGGATSNNYLLGSSALNRNITGVYIGNRVTVLNQNCLNGAQNMGIISLSGSVVRLEQYAFSNDYALKSIIIPDSVISLGIGVFYGCRSLTSGALSKNITSIGASAFSGCSWLEYINLPNVETLELQTFRYAASLKRVVIPETVTSIGASAFDGAHFKTFKCRGNSVESIASGCFTNCVADEIDIANCPLSVITGIATSHFTNKFIMPEFLTLPTGALSSSTGFYMRELDISRNTTVAPLASTSSVSASANVWTKIYVRQSLLESYKTATNWSTYATLFVGVPDDEIN